MSAPYRIYSYELCIGYIMSIAHRAIIFDNQCGEERLIASLNHLLNRYLFSEHG